MESHISPPRALKDRPFPLVPLVASALLIFDTIVGIHLYQTRHPGPIAPIDSATAVKTAQLRFVDHGDGASVYGGHVSVYDAATGMEFPPLRESDGFVRAVLNSLTFERTKRGISAPPIFELVYWSDNRITMKDPATGASISLGSFGAGNKVVFMRFFDHPEAGS